MAPTLVFLVKASTLACYACGACSTSLALDLASKTSVLLFLRLDHYRDSQQLQALCIWLYYNSLQQKITYNYSLQFPSIHASNNPPNAHYEVSIYSSNAMELFVTLLNTVLPTNCCIMSSIWGKKNSSRIVTLFNW